MTMCHTKWPDLIQYYGTARQTDRYFINRKKVLFVIQMKEIYVGPIVGNWNVSV